MKKIYYFCKNGHFTDSVISGWVDSPIYRAKDASSYLDSASSRIYCLGKQIDNNIIINKKEC
jgi:hypothetical protein